MESSVTEPTTLRVYNPLYERRHLYASYMNIPKFYLYAGVIVNNPTWVANDSICMTTEDPHYPMRIIPKKYIDGYEPIAPEKKIKKVKTWKFKGSKGDTYTVTRDSGRFECTCLGFQFRRSCKHVVKAKESK